MRFTIASFYGDKSCLSTFDTFDFMTTPALTSLLRLEIHWKNWETLGRPPCSPDFSLVTIVCFLRGNQFESNEEVDEHMRNWLTTCPQHFLWPGNTGTGQSVAKVCRLLRRLYYFTFFHRHLIINSLEVFQIEQ